MISMDYYFYIANLLGVISRNGKIVRLGSLIKCTHTSITLLVPLDIFTKLPIDL